MFKKILLINPFGIGDVLFTTPIIHTLKDISPNIKIGYLCNSRTASILRANPYVDSIFIYERDKFQAERKNSNLTWIKKIFKFINEIKKEHFDLALDFSLNSQYCFFCWLAGIKERVGYDFRKRGRFLTKKIRLSGYNDKHIVEYYAGLIKYLDIDLKHYRLELYLNKEDIEQIELILAKEEVKQTDSLIGIIPAAGRSWGKDAYLKHWPEEKFAQLADKIIENYPLKLIIMGDFFEKEIANNIINKMRHKAINFAGQTSLGEMAALLSKMKLVITNDGGPLHMAVALGVKTVSIFGPVDDKVYGPYPANKNNIVIKENLSCRPCYKNFRFPGCLNDRKCIQDINVDEIFLAVRSLI